MTNLRIPVLVGLLSTSLACAAAADVMLSDTEFANTVWVTETVATGGGGTSSGVQTAGGNPGLGRQVTSAVNAGGTVFSLNRYGTTQATRYAPADQGAIAMIDYSFDARWTGGPAGLDQSVMLGAKQGQVVYFADVATLDAGGAWATFSGLGLTAADFQPVTIGAAIDFSATGAPLRFGFIVRNASSDAQTFTAIADNFSVTIRQVPSPGGASVGVMAGLLLMRRRR